MTIDHLHAKDAESLYVGTVYFRSERDPKIELSISHLPCSLPDMMDWVIGLEKALGERIIRVSTKTVKEID